MPPLLSRSIYLRNVLSPFVSSNFSFAAVLEASNFLAKRIIASLNLVVIFLENSVMAETGALPWIRFLPFFRKKNVNINKFSRSNWKGRKM